MFSPDTITVNDRCDYLDCDAFDASNLLHR